MKRMSTEMSRGRLRALSIAGPLAGLAALYPVHLAAERAWSARVSDVLVGFLMLLGVVTFSTAIFQVIEGQDRRLAVQRAELAARHNTEHRLRAHLEALHEAALTITSDDTTTDILQHLVDLARDLIGTRYGALGVLGPQGAIDQFYTSGVEPEVKEQLDPRMSTLLAAPVRQRGQIVGNLYLADHVGGLPFSEEDQRLLTQLAGHVATIVHQARLVEEVRRLAATAERDRLRTTLRDNVIQRVFAVRLALEGTQEELPAGATAASAGIEHAIDQLGLVMEEVRLAIVGQDAVPTAALNGTEVGGYECQQSG
ncbi:MAG TPA: GAF domain-containing protein [Chloroflexota bacterium]|nr:GAF domain-containing protein [Chloroflexota bacterium]